MLMLQLSCGSIVHGIFQFDVGSRNFDDFIRTDDVFDWSVSVHSSGRNSSQEIADRHVYYNIYIENMLLLFVRQRNIITANQSDTR